MRIHVISAALLIAIAVLGAGCTEENQPFPGGDHESVLRDAASGINNEMESVKVSIAENARVLEETGLTSTAGKEALRQTLLRHPWMESILVISRDGVVVAAVPEDYADLVGRNLTYQVQTQRAVREQVPLMNEVFLTEEGFYGITQSYPIFGPEYLGYVSPAYQPDALIGRVIVPLTNGTPYDIWVTQTDGMVIYSTTPGEIGHNPLSDPDYRSPEHQEVFSRIVAEPSGSVEYAPRDQGREQNVTKEARWDTAGIDGIEWRVVIARDIDVVERR